MRIPIRYVTTLGTGLWACGRPQPFELAPVVKAERPAGWETLNCMRPAGPIAMRELLKPLLPEESNRMPSY